MEAGQYDFDTENEDKYIFKKCLCFGTPKRNWGKEYIFFKNQNLQKRHQPNKFIHLIKY